MQIFLFWQKKALCRRFEEKTPQLLESQYTYGDKQDDLLSVEIIVKKGKGVCFCSPKTAKTATVYCLNI